MSDVGTLTVTVSGPGCAVGTLTITILGNGSGSFSSGFSSGFDISAGSPSGMTLDLSDSAGSGYDLIILGAI